MITVSWYAELALRSRVSMSATGSVMVMAWRPSSPWFPSGPAAWSVGAGRAQVGLPAGLGDAGELAPVRHRPEADAAQPEPAVDRARPPAARAPGVVAHGELRRALCLGDKSLLRHWSVLPKRKSEPPQQRAALVVVGRGGDNGHVHAALPVHLVGVDLVEHELLGEAERVITAAVELLVAEPAEVTDPGQGQRQQPVAELPHPRPAQRDVRADRHAVPELELGHRLPRPGHGGLLPGDDRQVPYRAVD